MKKTIALLILVILTTAVSVPVVYGQATTGSTYPGSATTPSSGCGQTLCNPLRLGGTLQGFVTGVLNTIVLPVGAVVATFFIIYSGFLFVTAQGDSKKIEDAKTTFFYTVIGTLILLGAATIAGIIQATVDQLKS